MNRFLLPLLGLILCGIFPSNTAWGQQDNIGFQEFTRQFRSLDLPAEIDILAELCCGKDSLAINGSVARQFLPIDSTSLTIDDVFYPGYKAWVSGNDPWHEHQHIALIWFAESSHGMNDERFAFLTTYTMEGQLIDNLRLSYFFSSFNAESTQWSGINYWEDRWTVLSASRDVGRSLNGTHVSFNGYILYEISQEGVITPKNK